jgi:uncharacterized SAM-binding protein YcdF (DUF218 family)
VFEAQVLADQLVARGIEADCVIVEPTARNTRDNAVEMVRITRARKYERMVVVTSAFHLPRALGCSRAVGLEVDALPVDYRSFDPRRQLSWQPRAAYLDRSSTAFVSSRGG